MKKEVSIYILWCLCLIGQYYVIVASIANQNMALDGGQSLEWL
jgi:hypothetical protein